MVNGNFSTERNNKSHGEIYENHWKTGIYALCSSQYFWTYTILAFLIGNKGYVENNFIIVCSNSLFFCVIFNGFPSISPRVSNIIANSFEILKQ